MTSANRILRPLAGSVLNLPPLGAPDCKARNPPDRLERIDGAHHAQRLFVQHMGIDHRRLHIGVSQQLLHGSDVLPCLQQVRRKTLAEAMLCEPDRQSGLAQRRAHSTLQHLFVHVVASHMARTGIHRIVVRREARVRQPVPVERALAHHRQVVQVRLRDLQEEGEIIALHVLVHENFPRPVHDAHIHLLRMQIDSAVEFRRRRVILCRHASPL